MMLDKIFKSIVPRFGRLQAQVRVRDCTQGRDQDFTTRPLRTSKDGLKKFNRSFLVIKLRFNSPLQIALLLFRRNRGGPRLIQQASGAHSVLLIEQQLYGTQLGSAHPLGIGKKKAKQLQRFIGPLQGPKGFRLSEERHGPERRSRFVCDLLIKRKSIGPAAQAGEGLRTPKRDCWLIL